MKRVQANQRAQLVLFFIDSDLAIFSDDSNNYTVPRLPQLVLKDNIETSNVT